MTHRTHIGRRICMGRATRQVDRKLHSTISQSYPEEENTETGERTFSPNMEPNQGGGEYFP